MWLLAPNRPFNPNRFHFNFRWFWDYAGGDDRLGRTRNRHRPVRHACSRRPNPVMASGGKRLIRTMRLRHPTPCGYLRIRKLQYAGGHATGIDNGNYTHRRHRFMATTPRWWSTAKMGSHPETQWEDGINKYEVDAYSPAGQSMGCRLWKDAQNLWMPSVTTPLLNCGIETGGIAAINAQMGKYRLQNRQKGILDKGMGLFKNDKIPVRSFLPSTTMVGPTSCSRLFAFTSAKPA